MSERGNLTPEKGIESRETVENDSEQVLEEATHEPGSRVEQSQEFTQAETIETVLVAAVEKVAEEPEPGPDPFQPAGTETEVENVAGEGQRTSDQRVGVDQVAGHKDPGDPPPPPDRSAQSGVEVGSGREVSPIPVPLPSPSNEAEGSDERMAPEQTADAESLVTAEPEISEVESRETVVSSGPENTLADEPGHGPDPITNQLDNDGILISGEAESTVLNETVGTLEVEETTLTATPESDASDEQVNEEGLDGAEEYWEPPEVYVHVDSNGKVTVVDKNGNPIDAPPVVQAVVDEKGATNYVAQYPGMGPNAGFAVTTYKSVLGGLFIHKGQDGTVSVVDKDGNPVKAPPMVTVSVDGYGAEQYQIHYPGDDPNNVKAIGFYKPALEKDIFVHVDSNGKLTAVDANGNPLKSPPVIQVTVDEGGAPVYLAKYPGDESVGVAVSTYSASIENCYAHVGQDGAITVVDANGQSIPGQPKISKVVDAAGAEQIVVWYPGSGEPKMITLKAYTAQIDAQKMFVHIGSDGKPMVVDATGKPIANPPVITTFVDANGAENYQAQYPGGTSKAELTAYSATLDNQKVFAHIDQSGKITVVGADGKPISGQPIITKVVDASGMEQIVARYPGDDPNKITPLNWFKPPSGWKKGMS